MENQKVFIITDDNGSYKDVIVSGDEGKKELAHTTREFIERSNDSEWVKYRVVELLLEGAVHIGKLNIITTIKLNNIPVRAIANNFYNLIEVVESYINLEDDYKKYNYNIDFVKL